MMHYTYVLKNKKDERFYTGVTNDLRKRLSEHNKGMVKPTKYRMPLGVGKRAARTIDSYITGHTKSLPQPSQKARNRNKR